MQASSTRCRTPTSSSCCQGLRTIRKPCSRNAAAAAPGQRFSPGTKSLFLGRRINSSSAAHNGSTHRSMSRWLENKAQIEVPVSLELAWALWDDRERIPKWMPWIKSVKVLETDPRMSRWTLSTHQFGRDWEFSWLARNLQPVKNQKIHWVSEPGTASLPGVEIANQGQIRFVRKGPASCSVTLTISYEVPDVLGPFAQALTPLVEGVIGKDMERFREYALDYQTKAAAAAAVKL